MVENEVPLMVAVIDNDVYRGGEAYLKSKGLSEKEIFDFTFAVLFASFLVQGYTASLALDLVVGKEYSANFKAAFISRDDVSDSIIQ